MTITARHCAHNDLRRIRERDRQIDRLVIALARYGVHESECARLALYQGDSAIGAHIVCSCGLTAVIETRGAA